MGTWKQYEDIWEHYGDVETLGDMQTFGDLGTWVSGTQEKGNNVRIFRDMGIWHMGIQDMGIWGDTGVFGNMDIWDI